jgi:CubicO group peptidase (beta-lactamase class C family)
LERFCRCASFTDIITQTSRICSLRLVQGMTGMKVTGYDSNTVVIPRRATNYIPGKNSPEHVSFVHMSTPFSAGSTTEDFLRWEQGLFGGKLLSTESLAKMISPSNPRLPDGCGTSRPCQWIADGPWINNNAYAFGIFVATMNGHKFIHHAGGVGAGIPGNRAYFVYLPDEQLTVVVLANLDNGAVFQIGLRLVDLALGSSKF